MQFKRSNNSQPKRQYCASAALREQLTNELSAISSSEEAANWAHRVLGAKKSLTPADAARVEQAFQDRLASLIRPPTLPGHKSLSRQSTRQVASGIDLLSIKVCSHCLRRAAFATLITSNR